MSPSGRLLIGLFLYFRQGQTKMTCQVDQVQLLVVAVVNEHVSFQCEYSCANINQSAPTLVNMFLYKDTPQNTLDKFRFHQLISNFKMKKAWGVTASGMNYTGMYYCRMTTLSQSFTGTGTLLQMEAAERPAARMAGYAMMVISFLAMYSLSVTVAVIIKRKTCSQCKLYWMRTLSGNTPKPSATDQKQSTTERLRGQSTESSEDENAYMALQTPEESIYNILHKEGSTSAAEKSPKRKSVQLVEAKAEVYECVYETF